jgi:Amidohydrolase family
VALDHERGVSIAMGTDLSISGAELATSWGRNGRELPLLVEAGLTPLDAIQAATANGLLTLGPQAPCSGQFAEGYDADLITLDGEPLADITILANPSHVAGVWKAGHRVKGRSGPGRYCAVFCRKLDVVGQDPVDAAGLAGAEPGIGDRRYAPPEVGISPNCCIMLSVSG